MAELQEILDRRRSSTDKHITQALGRRISKLGTDSLAFRSGWSSTPGCAGRNSFEIFTPRVSLISPRSDDDNRQGVPEYENTSDADEVEVDVIMKSGDVQVQRALEQALAERDAARLDAATMRGDLNKAQAEIEQLRDSLRRMSSSTDMLLGALHEQQLELSRQAEKDEESPFISAALGVFDLLDLDQDGKLSTVDVQVFAELMTPPKDPQTPEVLCQKIWQQLGMSAQESMGRSEWLQLIQAKAGSALGKPLSIVDLERLVSSLEALEAAGMRRF